MNERRGGPTHAGPSAGAKPGGGLRAQHQREFFRGPSGQALAAGGRAPILLFPHLPCQAWPDGQRCVSANYTSGVQEGLAAREPCIGRRLMNPPGRQGPVQIPIPSRFPTLWAPWLLQPSVEALLTISSSLGMQPLLERPGTSFCQPRSSAELRGGRKQPHNIETAAQWEWRSRGASVHVSLCRPWGCLDTWFRVRAQAPCWT